MVSTWNAGVCHLLHTSHVYVDVRAKSSTSARVALFCKFIASFLELLNQFYIILNKFGKFCRSHILKKIIICSALHLVLRLCRNGLMVVNWPKHAVVVKINTAVFNENQKLFYFSCINTSEHYATSRKVAGSIPDGVIGIFH